MNLSHNLRDTAARIPHAPALVFGEQPFSYAALEEQVCAFAAALSASGIGAGDRVALWLGNDPAFVVGLYGAWRSGAIVVPLHAGLTEPEARYILTDSETRLVVCGQPQVEAGALKLRDEVPSLERIVVTGEAWDAFLGSGTETPDRTSELALIAYTSGTSGLPKGAMLTHENLNANIDQMRKTAVVPGEGDVSLCVLPLFHIFGLNVVLNLSIDVGAEVVLMDRFDPAASLDVIREHQVTHVSAAPPVYVAWLGLSVATSTDFADVRVAVSGAAPLPREVLSGMKERFGVTVWEGYGLTETSPTLTITAVGGKAKPGSVGLPVDGVELKLVGADGDEAEPGDPGEIWVRGPNVFRGYWNHPDDTKAAFRDGWFRTGDIGIFDDEGYLYIVDRRRDMIIVSGFNVYPKEVEDALRAHPGVEDCAVVGRPDPYSGEKVQAWVVAPGVSVDDLREHARGRLAAYKLPADIEVVESIPRNAAGKALRRMLRN